MKESEYLRLKRARLTVDDFTPIKIIGKGAFGEVSIPFIEFLISYFFFQTAGLGESSHEQCVCVNVSV